MRFDIAEIEAYFRDKNNKFKKENPYYHLMAPKISKQKMDDILKNVKLFHHNHGDESVMWEMEVPDDLINSSYIWLPRLTVKSPPLKKVKDIFTFHFYGYYGVFKPSVEEVLRQLQYEDLTNVYGISINGPSNERDLKEYIGILNKGFHVAKVTLWALSQ